MSVNYNRIEASSQQKKTKLSQDVDSAGITLKHEPRGRVTYWALCMDPALKQECPLVPLINSSMDRLQGSAEEVGVAHSLQPERPL